MHRRGASSPPRRASGAIRGKVPTPPEIRLVDRIEVSPHRRQRDGPSGGVNSMKDSRVHWLMAGVLILGGGPLAARAAADDLPPVEPPDVIEEAPPPGAIAAVLPGDDPGPVKPLAEGPLHEAFLSP